MSFGAVRSRTGAVPVRYRTGEFPDRAPRAASTEQLPGSRVLFAAEEAVEHLSEDRLVGVGRSEQGHARAQLDRVDAAEDLLGARRSGRPDRCRPGRRRPSPGQSGRTAATSGPAPGGSGSRAPRPAQRWRTAASLRSAPGRRSAERRTTSNGWSSGRVPVRRPPGGRSRRRPAPSQTAPARPDLPSPARPSSSSGGDRLHCGSTAGRPTVSRPTRNSSMCRISARRESARRYSCPSPVSWR